VARAVVVQLGEQTVGEDVEAVDVPADVGDARVVADPFEPATKGAEVEAAREEAVHEDDGCAVSARDTLAPVDRGEPKAKPFGRREPLSPDRRPRDPLVVVHCPLWSGRRAVVAPGGNLVKDGRGRREREEGDRPARNNSSSHWFPPVRRAAQAGCHRPVPGESRAPAR
jgi:hypothetical protein